MKLVFGTHYNDGKQNNDFLPVDNIEPIREEKHEWSAEEERREEERIKNQYKAQERTDSIISILTAPDIWLPLLLIIGGILFFMYL